MNRMIILNIFPLLAIYSNFGNIIPLTNSFSLNIIPNHQRNFQNGHQCSTSSSSSSWNTNNILVKKPRTTQNFFFSRSSLSISSTSSNTDTTEVKRDLTKLGEDLTSSLNSDTNGIYRDIKVSISPSANTHRLGLHTNTKVKSKDVALSIPYDDQVMFTPNLSKSCLKQYLPKEYDGWTGDTGLIALMLLNELARLSSSPSNSERLPSRTNNVQSFISTWITSLPTIQEMSDNNNNNNNPLFWNEEDQERLQSSSTKKIYRLLDDIEEDYKWLEENIFSKDRDYFPETVDNIVDQSLFADEKTRSHDCFNLQGFTWALSIVYSRSFFIDGTLRLIPILDFANHDENCEELQGNKYMGTFGTVKGAQLKSSSKSMLMPGDELYISYGPKSSIEYLLEYGFLPFEHKLQNKEDEDMKTLRILRPYAISQLTFEIDSDARFHDDKLDILETEAGLDTRQTFDIYEDTDTPDPFMMQFLRLIKLDNTDAFLLESIFRREVWDFMAYPVSEKNEEAVVDYVINVCNQYITELESTNDDKDEDSDLTMLSDVEKVCSKVCALELRALRATQEYMMRDREALDLKEYYQERRLKDLGLDSDWNLDDDMDLGLGESKRVPGGGDLDW